MVNLLNVYDQQFKQCQQNDQPPLLFFKRKFK